MQPKRPACPPNRPTDKPTNQIRQSGAKSKQTKPRTRARLWEPKWPKQIACICLRPKHPRSRVCTSSKPSSCFRRPHQILHGPVAVVDAVLFTYSPVDNGALVSPFVASFICALASRSVCNASAITILLLSSLNASEILLSPPRICSLRRPSKSV